LANTKLLAEYYAIESHESEKKDIMPYVVYILECSDGSYYTGSAANLGRRLWEHETGASTSAYTFSRRPVKLVWTSEKVARYSDALRFERQIKGWSRSKKEALIRGNYEAVHEVVKRRRKRREEINRNLRAERSDDCL
jgi:predicted GIY-YIG superfamily endonuclease